MMLRTFRVPVAVVLSLVISGAGRADDQADVKALLDKAIKAHGGADALNKYKASTVKSKGKFYGMGDGIDYTSEASYQQPAQFQMGIDLDIMGMQIKFVQVVNGNKGWIKINDMVMDMTKEQLEEAQAQIFQRDLARLTMLTDKAFKLSSVGEVKVGDRAAVGLRVEHKGKRDVTLFFDKESGLLLKAEMMGKDPMAGDKEFTGETLFGDYKKVDGVQTPHKVTILRDGKKYVEAEVTEVKHLEKLEDSTFAKP